jgi:hypothetical protein
MPNESISCSIAGISDNFFGEDSSGYEIANDAHRN